MNHVLNLSRRGFLKAGVMATGGLLLGVHLPQLASAATNGAGQYACNAFVRIGTDGIVTVIANHSEMGQGIYTGLAMLVAEELDADWSKVRVEPCSLDPVYSHKQFGIIGTGGSTSSWTEYDRLREAGASARAMLVAAAAQQWGVAPTSLATSDGVVSHGSSGKKASYGELAEKASTQTPPKDVKLKDPKDFKIVGKPTKRLDTPDKTNGKAVFGLDVNVPGMLIALVERPPVFRGKVKSFNADKAKAMPGVRHVVEIDRGIAVVADTFWQAKNARAALEVTWDDGALATLDSGQQMVEYADLIKKSGAVARDDGKASEAFANAAQKFDLTYELPYLAHAPMEPLNCVADVRADSCEIWTGTQMQTLDAVAAATITGLTPDKITLHTTLLGGGFGRRAVTDGHFVAEAVQISKAVKTPIKVIWTREDDIRGGYYRPSSRHSVKAGLDAGGNLVAFEHHIACQSLARGTVMEPMMIRNGLEGTSVEGSAEIPYAIPNVHVEWHEAPPGVPTLWVRSVGHPHNAFVVETLMDELAHAAGKDAFEFRRALLKDKPRHRGVLELAAAKAKWGSALPAGRARGIAVHESFGSFVSQVAEVSLSPEGWPRVHHVTCAVDCGPIVNPETIRAQIEGAVAFGLTSFLYGEITFKEGRVQQRNFHDYPMVRMNEMPTVDVHIVESTEKMGGIGETGVPPVAPAVANAIFALTGKRLRKLPYRLTEMHYA